MAEKLSVTIALNGAEEIKRQLADVGQAGEDAFKQINQAAADVGGFNKLDPSVVTEKLKQTGVAGKDVAKVLNAVNQAGRMETLVNGIAAAENGLRSMGEAVGLLIPSVRTMGRLLFAAVSAATVGAVVSTTKAIMELDAAAIQAGVSIESMGKARQIFEAIGISSKSAAEGVSSFFEKINLEKVKDAVAAIDEFGRVSKVGDFFKILTEAAKGTGEAADLARKKLEELGKLRPSAAAEEIDRIKQSAMGLPQQLLAIIGVLQNMGNTAERNRIIFSSFNKAFATELIQALNAGGVSLDALKQKLAGLPSPSQAAAEAAARLSLAWQNFKNMVASGFAISPEVLDAIAASLNQITVAMTAVGAAAAAFNAAITSALSGNLFGNTLREIQTIINLLGSLGQIGFQAMKYIEAGAIATWETIIGWINKAIDAVKRFFGAGGGQATGAGAQGMARGGLMGGRGSGTSDSNLAWLSRGEHVMPAYAVRQPGVLTLLEALRRSGGNLRSVLDRMGHFAMGGLVGAPAFAAGGINGMNHVTIAFPGLPAIGGLRASSAVVDELRRAAALAQVRSGGRKPSRYS